MAREPRVKFCSYCGAVGTARIGICVVCHLAVCEHCGNTQYIKGECTAVHDKCLSKTGDAFSMIKFVK